ncbi:helix-turn-helix transcriptional regulator [Candidatus Poriferisodalis sp.]|uniref:helix-turn-helix transcriptional regulator n=1 Tax=Candidatus Poriferisodalis sp. TaxID=3101277 RepID=UPI003B020C67
MKAPQSDLAPPPRLMTAAEVQQLLGIGRTVLYRLQRDHGFPDPIRLATKSVRWRADEVTAWLDSRERVTCDAVAV